MNKERREALNKLIEKVSDIRDEVQALLDEEQDYFDNMPESLQSGEKGEAAEAAVQEMDEAISSLDSAESSLGNATA